MEHFDQQRYDKIEAWLRGRLPADEAARFEAELAADPALQEQVDLQRFEHAYRERLVRDGVREQVRAWSAQHPPAARRRWLWLLAPLLLAAGWWWWQGAGTPGQSPAPGPAQPGPPPVEQMPETVPPGSQPPPTTPPGPNRRAPLRPAPIAALVERRDAALRTNRVEFGDRGRGGFAATIERYRSLSPADPEYDDRALELGRAFLHTGAAARAIPLFRSLISRLPPSDERRQFAEWYLILGLLDDYERNQADTRRLLLQLSRDAQHPYHEEAREFLGIIE